MVRSSHIWNGQCQQEARVLPWFGKKAGKGTGTWECQEAYIVNQLSIAWQDLEIYEERD